MAKPRNLHVCQECGYESAKWLGKCPSCEAWNSLVEEVREKKSTSSAGSGPSARRAGYGASAGGDPVPMAQVERSTGDRLGSENEELDRVLGGGFVAGGVVLLGGDPGIGKSTLSLQIGGMLASRGLTVLYVSGEESLGQLKMRGDRLCADIDEVLVVGETRLERVEELVEEYKPDFLVLDSIQTLTSEELGSSP